MAKDKDAPEAATPATATPTKAADAKAPEAATPATAGRYRVTFNGLSWEDNARDANEAWAKFNDAHKTSYGPKVAGRTVEKVG